MTKEMTVWYSETIEFVNGFMEWAGESNIIRQALTIMWMGWYIRDIDTLVSLTGYDKDTVTYFVERAIDNKIWVNDDKMNADDWFLVDDGGSAQDENACMIAVLLDAMTMAGDINIEYNEGRIYTNSNDITGMCIVQNSSCRGSHFEVSDVRMVGGKKQIRLKQRKCGNNQNAAGGQWRPASDYIIKGHKNETKAAV